MPRERVYRNNAEKQAAYRVRDRRVKPPRQRALAACGQELHMRLRDAIATGENQVPAELLGKQADETLINSMKYVRGAFPKEPKGTGIDPILTGRKATACRGEQNGSAFPKRRPGETASRAGERAKREEVRDETISVDPGSRVAQF